MATVSRYDGDVFVAESGFRSANAVLRIRNAINIGQVQYTERVLKEGERLDIIAGQVYGDGRLWWVISAASNIGWPLQAPAGTILRIPNLESVLGVL